MKLFVAKLPWAVTSQSLKELFESCGPVISATVAVDKESKKSKGFGFIEMSDEDGRKAIKQLDGQTVQGRQIVVKEAEDRSNMGNSRFGSNRQSGNHSGNRRDNYNSDRNSDY